MTPERVIEPVPLTPCHYCGLPASTIDHVVPKVVLQQLAVLDDDPVTARIVRRRRVLTVDACMECNALLGARYFDTLAQRTAALKASLQKRYRRYLALPEWSDAEIAGMSDRLQRRVIASLEMRRLLLKRLAYGSSGSGRLVPLPDRIAPPKPAARLAPPPRPYVPRARLSVPVAEPVRRPRRAPSPTWRELRTARGWTQRELARRTGVGIRDISLIDNYGCPTPDQARRLLVAYGLIKPAPEAGR